MEEKTSIIDAVESPILIVEDNPQYAKVLERMLKAALGYTNITHVDNTAEAFKRIEQDPSYFRLLFVDYNFPIGESGGRLLEKLQESKLLQGKAAFLITSDPSVENVKQATNAGAVGVVAKPFNTEQIRVQLDKARRSLFAEEVDYF
jgi:DNA-binding NtrC family response regulator